MSRRAYQRYRTTGAGGINQEFEKASENQLADARNVWAPDGRIIQRPGYVGLARIPINDLSTQTLAGVSEDVSTSTFTDESGVTGRLDLSSFVARTASVSGDRFYVGHTAVFDSLNLPVTQANSNDTRVKAEYYNGTSWQYIPVTCFTGSNAAFTRQNSALAATAVWYWPRPKDWTQVAVNGRSRFWIRFTLWNADFDASVEIDLNEIGTRIGTNEFNVQGIFRPEYLDGSHQIHVVSDINNAVSVIVEDFAGSTFRANTYTTANEQPPATIAVVPQFNEAFVAYGKRVTRIALPKENSALAAIEDNEAFVGTGAPFDDNFVAQEGQFPRANIIRFFKGTLWAAGIENDPFTVRWSAPQPFHKIWPSINAEPLMEDDNSPITAMEALGEHMVVFKQDSIWLMLDAGINDFGLQEFVPRRIVAGVGCVAQNSIQQIRGRLIFLAEDGIYAFDGTPNIVKLSEAVDETIRTIRAAKRVNVASAHWRTRNLYILAAETKAGTTDINDTNFVWDYKNNAWWIWDGIDAKSWLSTETSADNEQLIFADSLGSIYEVNKGRTSNGAAINSSFTTQRINLFTNFKARARSVELTSTNKAQSATIELLANDESSGQSGTLDFTDSNEETWATLQWGTGATDSYYEERRRARRIGVRKDYDWLQVKVTHSVKNEPFALTVLDLGWFPLGYR
jgi:hypothetical protein